MSSCRLFSIYHAEEGVDMRRSEGGVNEAVARYKEVGGRPPPILSCDPLLRVLIRGR